MKEILMHPVVGAMLAGVIFLLLWYWLESLLFRRQHIEATYVRMSVIISLRRQSPMALPLVRQHVAIAGLRIYGDSALEFVEQTVEAEPDSAAHRRHIIVYLVRRDVLGPDPGKRMALLQRMLYDKGLPCSITTDPDVGSVLNPPS